tara:strand:+ start:10583 stop:11455 length:873 start_codon:yes stop_codon:yes gene_type:complete
MDDVSVVGITSRTITKAEKLSNDYNIENVYNNIYELTEKCVLDALLICVSADQIFSVTEKLIPKQIPLFIEKPPGLVPKETDTLFKLADKNGTKNMVGYNRRFYSVFHKGIEIIKKSGRLLGVSVEGHERFWKVVNRKPQNILDNWLYANSTHTIDLLHFFGGEITSFNTISKSFKEKNGDQFVATVEFESGSLGTYTAYWYSPGGWSVTLYGEGVTVIFGPLEKGKWIDTNFTEYKIEPDELDKKYKPGFHGQLKAFCNMLNNGSLEWPGQDLAGALKTMQLAQKLLYV